MSHIADKAKRLQDLFDEQLDVLYYLEDIYNLQIIELHEVMIL